MDLSPTLETLGLTGQRFSLAQKRHGKMESACFSNVEAAEKWVGAGDLDTYICGNPVRPGTQGKPSEDDMASGRILLVDCDPKKCPEKDPTGTTDERRDAAWTTAMSIWESFHKSGVLVDSGRGAQVWLRVEAGINRLGLLSWIRDHFHHELVDIDATQDLSRLMRLPGSVNTRTGDEVIEIDRGDPTPVRRSEVAELLQGWAAPAEAVICEVDRSAPSRMETRRYLSGAALKMWREDPMEITLDRSKRDFMFLCAVLEAGAPLEAASRLLHALPGSKASERGDDNYWDKTAASAMRALGRKAEEAELLAGLADACRNNHDLLTAKNTLKALARVYLEDHAEWLRTRAKLAPIARKAGISIASIDKLVCSEIHRIQDSEVGPPDDLMVFVRSEDGGKGSWKLRDATGAWSWVNRGDVEVAAEAKGLNAVQTVGAAMHYPFTINAEPFQPRILPGRRWNESNARFAVEPKEGKHPTWDQLIRVVGRGLDSDLEASEWARKNGIKTGADYLRAWLSTMLQNPKSRRAYLFLYSREQGTGKSLFFESVKILIGDAVVKGNRALLSEGGFNGELRRAVLVYSEEVNLGGSGRSKVYNRIKDWSLSLNMSIHVKGGTVFEVPNVMSFGHAANDPRYCPVFEGDDRITMLRVEPARADERTTKEDLEKRLRAEAPAFLYSLLNDPTPTSKGRYVVPPISTEAKRQQAKASRDELQVWMSDHPEWITLGDIELQDTFRNYLELRGLDKKWWSPSRIMGSLPEQGDKARQIVQVLKSRDSGRWTATEAAKEFGLGSAVKAGAILRQISSVWTGLTATRSKGRDHYSL